MIGWLALVSKARSPRELCEITRYFLASLTPEEWATVPQECWPRVKAVDDLRYWHDRLADEFCSTAVGTGPSRTHRELMTFFSAVVERLARIETAVDDAASNDQSAGGEERRAPANDEPLSAGKHP
ncbi:MAG TPA: hypothetical protein VFP36_04500 [Usitatibacter sp.]|nr:hypothetical protein [Usitatibacter sp.]